MWLWLASCCFPAGFTPAPDPAPAPPPAPQVESGFVAASRLRLRPEPRPDTATYSTLSINTKVRLGERRGDWIAVTAPDGRIGWVNATFVADAPLTIETVRARIEAAQTPEERLAWWQRAAALRPSDPEVLDGLTAAYRAAGRPADAEIVERNRRDLAAQGLAALFPGRSEDLAATARELEAADSPKVLFAAWAKARTLLRELDEPLNARQDDNGSLQAGDEPLLEREIPWAYLTWYAEGTSAALELRSGTFLELAAHTRGDLDDRFFAFVTRAYDNAGGYGWAAWEDRNWDYGGCSPFGSSTLHLELLQLSDALQGQPVPDLAAEIRADVLEDVTQGTPEFPYCNGSLEPTPPEALIRAAETLLDKIALSPDERTVVRKRIETRFANP